MKKDYFFKDISGIDYGLFRVMFIKSDDGEMELEFEVFVDDKPIHGLYDEFGEIIYNYSLEDIHRIYTVFPRLQSGIANTVFELTKKDENERKVLKLEDNPAYGVYGIFMKEDE